MNANFFYDHHVYVFSVEDHNKFLRTIRENNSDNFRGYMDILMNNDEIDRYILEKNLRMDVTEFRERILYAIATYSINSADILEVLLSEYNFQPNDKYIDYVINLYTSSEIFIVLKNYVDLPSYFPKIKRMFWRECRIIKVFESIKKTIVDLNFVGLSTRDLCDMQDCKVYYETLLYYLIENGTIEILKYFLDEGLDFKKYETESILYCINVKKIEELKLLIDYGADLSVIEKINIDPDYSGKIKMYNFLLKNNIDPFKAAIFI